MLGGSISDTVEILDALIKSKNYKVVALTNWSHETFPIAQKRFEFLEWFDGIVVSGDEKTRKPFKEIYYIKKNKYMQKKVKMTQSLEPQGIASFT